MITYILTVMSLHCSLAYSSMVGHRAEPNYECAPQLTFIEFTDGSEAKAERACNQHKAEVFRLVGKHKHKVAASCAKKGSK